MSINLLDIYDFLTKCRYKKGQYIYYCVLHRNFGDETERAVRLMTDNALAVKDTLLRCPHCNSNLGRKSAYVQDNSWECNEAFCDSCDRFVPFDKAIEEPMWIASVSFSDLPL